MLLLFRKRTYLNKYVNPHYLEKIRMHKVIIDFGICKNEFSSLIVLNYLFLKIQNLLKIFYYFYIINLNIMKYIYLRN